MKVVRPNEVMNLARHALANGGELSRHRVVTWKVSGNCTDPITFGYEGRPGGGRHYSDLEEGGDDSWKLSKEILIVGDRSYYVDKPVTPKGGAYLKEGPMWVDITARCRKCEKCLRSRASNWAYRAKSEIAAAPRTWFGTLTLSAHHQNQAANLARSELAGTGVDFDRLSPEQQFVERVRYATPEITRWLKRVRKQSKAKLRYILVAEAHKSGLPHFHLLVHEKYDGGQVKYAHLGDQWKLGFTKFKLVEGTGTAWYVCKYLSKSALSRVRASVGYGKTTSVIGALDPSNITHQKGATKLKAQF